MIINACYNNHNNLEIMASGLRTQGLGLHLRLRSALAAVFACQRSRDLAARFRIEVPSLWATHSPAETRQRLVSRLSLAEDPELRPLLTGDLARTSRFPYQ